jgi:hypothetical protein
VRLDHVASRIVNANHGSCVLDENLQENWAVPDWTRCASLGIIRDTSDESTFYGWSGLLGMLGGGHQSLFAMKPKELSAWVGGHRSSLDRWTDCHYVA